MRQIKEIIAFLCGSDLKVIYIYIYITVNKFF